MVLCALHEPNYHIKAIIVAIVIYVNNYYVFVSNCFIRFYKHILNMIAIATCGYFTLSKSVLLIYLQDVIKFKIRTLNVYF